MKELLQNHGLTSSPALLADDLNVIIFIDDRTFVRHCITTCLQTSYEYISILSFSNIQELVKAEIESAKVAFVLYGIYHRRASDPDVEQGLWRLKREFPSVPIIVLSDGESADSVLSALERGALGYISTNVSLDVVVGATRLVMAGGTFVPATSLIDLLDANAVEATTPTGRFTKRQLDVMHRVRQGKTNRTIARELEMSQSTVKAHVRNLMQRLKATNRTQLAFLTKNLFAASYHPSAPPIPPTAAVRYRRRERCGIGGGRCRIGGRRCGIGGGRCRIGGRRCGIGGRCGR